MRAIFRLVSLMSVMSGAVLVVAPAVPSYAEPGPIGQWLMNKPVTLWDKGMRRMREEADRAAKGVAEDAGTNGWANTEYNWDNNEIDITLTVYGFGGDFSHENCNKTRHSFIGALTGLLTKPEEGMLQVLMPILISGWFSHIGFQEKTRDEKLGEKMARIIFVRVILRGNNGSVTCRERVMTLDAPSKPL